MLRTIRLSITAGAYLLLVACVSQPDLEEDFDAIHNEARLLDISHWQLRGRAVLQTTDRTDTVGIDWRQEDARFQLALSGPGGWGRYTVSGSHDFTALKLDEGFDQFSDQEHQQISSQIEALPLSHLVDWVKGLCPSCSESSVVRDELGRLSAFESGVWKVYYDDYQWVDDLSLPRTMRFSGPRSSGKLVLKHWQLGEGS